MDSYRHSEQEATGVLLVNLGTPDAPTTTALMRYLREFLSDRRVIEVPRAIWYPILYGFILPFRSPRSAAAYRSVWSEQGSPLLRYSRGLASALQQRLGDQSVVRLAMRYGEPSIERALDEMQQHGVRRLLLLPMYPQYSATTTASVFDGVTAALRKRRWIPELRAINQYHHRHDWQQAVADRIAAFRRAHGAADKLLFSFHGIPKKYFLDGDPYFCQCHASARLIAARLGLGEDQWQVSFQSRLGRAEWLKPYTDETVKQLARDGVRHLQVVCPGFAVDCLETIEEVIEENGGYFRAAGGDKLEYIPALNDESDHVDVLAALIGEHTAQWPPTEAGAGGSERARRAGERAAALDYPLE